MIFLTAYPGLIFQPNLSCNVIKWFNSVVAAQQREYYNIFILKCKHILYYSIGTRSGLDWFMFILIFLTRKSLDLIDTILWHLFCSMYYILILINAHNIGFNK